MTHVYLAQARKVCVLRGHDVDRVRQFSYHMQLLRMAICYYEKSRVTHYHSAQRSLHAGAR